ncbi:MAG: GH1 family beta-glucosidase, partial [candidate division KSB1 bacterium]|nr:GH1 family beta-glucosidase [candidate division KSB1 bacterium]
HTANVACDHYHLSQQHIKLMTELGLQAYRISLAWPRILPLGKGKVNPKGVDFYSRLVDRLLDAGIQPFVTLYHWDLPQALQEKGGWANRDTVYYFRDYVAVVAQKLGDRVNYWITQNEPSVAAFAGHHEGTHAPGIKDLATALQVSHHLLLSHGEAVKVLREITQQRAQIGISLCLSPMHPASERGEDREAAQREDNHLNRWFLDPVYKGQYPQDLVKWYGELFPKIKPEDLEVISTRIDFLGLNYYFRCLVKANPEGGFWKLNWVKPENAEFTEMGWEVYPQGLYELLKLLHTEYQAPTIFITENGAAFSDQVDQDGRVRDFRRLKYLKQHLIQAHRAIQEGVKLAGYFVWSLLDNFEWAYGYTKRFGLIYVDYETQKRIIKESGYWYRKVIEQNGLLD